MERFRIGLDIGALRTTLVALASDGKVLHQEETPTPAKDYQATLNIVGRLVYEAEHKIGARGTVGVAVPGRAIPGDGRLNSSLGMLHGKPLAKDLQSSLSRKLRLVNNANCFAFSESKDGNAAGAGLVFGAFLDVSAGAGIVANGKVLTGKHGLAGEWAHNPLPWPRGDELRGAKCYCGKRGCIETFLSVPGLTRFHTETTNKTLAADVILQQAAAGHAECKITLLRFEDCLARALAYIVNLLDPSVIVLGGSLAQGTQLCESIPQIWTPYLQAEGLDTKLVPPKHGEASVARGAAWLGV